MNQKPGSREKLIIKTKINNYEQNQGLHLCINMKKKDSNHKQWYNSVTTNKIHQMKNRSQNPSNEKNVLT